ncbi:carbohydrate kinase [Paucibacter sp. PLA-PC-4]|uniref:carbohydrate kinase family protein n=1 Tax=Paucibacter sp. PLA-PC-4 TaxID=2993655 RepID=UPI002249811B|nr:carbohydrate kinase [Paucibacter sp. PLA-PC-4]MCX2862042.1 carbohydrate kinase [Paucibacter sp. PLA-PC-4]
MFVVCGEAIFDVFAAGETPTGLLLDGRVGGSPFNVAVGLARLGQPVCMLTQISKDFLGERLMRVLQAEGVDTRAVQRAGAPTTLSLVGFDAQGLPAYTFYGQGGADRLLSPDALDALPAAGASVIHLGSYASVVGPGAATLRTLVERARGRSLIAYDPNVRLNVEPDLAVWRAQIEWMLPRTDVLKLSEEDLGLVYPGRVPADFAAAALACGVGCVVLTRGAQGAVAWSGAGRVEAAPVDVAVIDTVGAGDTFQAALLTWMAEHAALSAGALAALSRPALGEALSFAARAAAITCSRRGADLPRRAELPV